MESYIQISKINDFTFCPRSLYFHGVYDSFDKSEYQEEAQIEGTLRHAKVDEGGYSSRKNIITGLPVYSKEFNIAGKIDIYDRDLGHLIERKTIIRQVHEGYRMQLYAQYYALTEMGHVVDRMYLHSLKDNKRYEVAVPMEFERERFLYIINKIQSYSILNDETKGHISKCKHCIYRNLCDQHDIVT